MTQLCFKLFFADMEAKELAPVVNQLQKVDLADFISRKRLVQRLLRFGDQVLAK